MFDSMFAGDPILQLILGAIALILAIAGFYWMYRITNDIEDN
jgi:hypothetical protein